MKKIIISALIAVCGLFFSCNKDTDEPDPNVIEEGVLVNRIDESYGSDPKQKFNIFIPQGHSTTATPVLFFIHGGGWNSGDKQDFDSTIASYKRLFSYYAIVTINYRLYNNGNNKFPAQEQDIKSCIEYVLIHSTDYGISQRFGIIGVGEGAQFGLLYAYKYGNNSYKPSVVVDWSGETDLMAAYKQTSSSSIKTKISNVAGNITTADSMMYINSSPLHFLASSSSAPSLVLHGFYDTLVSSQQADLLKNKLQMLGVPHTYKLYSTENNSFSTAATTDALTQIKNFITVYLY